MTEGARVDRDRVDAAISRRVHFYLRPVSLGLMLLYSAFVVLHFLVLSPPASWVLGGLCALTATVCAGLWLSWADLPRRAPYPHIIGAVISGFVLANVLSHLALTSSLQQTTHLMLMLLGASVLLLSSRWLIGVTAATIAGWTAVVWATGPYESTVHYGTSLATTALLAGIIHVSLRRSTRESERRRLSAEQLQRALSRALTSEAQARRELEETNEALEDAVNDANELNEMQAAFLSDMSHEIRTPLTSIIGFAEVLSEEDTDNPERFADLIRQSSERLMETVNSVLDLSKLKRGVAEFRPSKVDVCTLLADTVRLFQARADADDIDLCLDTPDEPVHAYLDASSLNRVLSNLISNAVKFCDRGDRVTVELSASTDAVTIRVHDTGPGIRPEFRAKLFEPFQRDDSLTREGTGLGLTITRRLVDAMSGRIHVDSVYGEGTTFTIHLPRRMDQTNPA